MKGSIEKESKAVSKKCGVCWGFLFFIIIFGTAVLVVFIFNPKSVRKTGPLNQHQEEKIISSKRSFKTVALGSGVFSLELADTPQKRALGLSGREKLDSDKGMLFVFEKEGRYSFWMKDMKFPLDIIWLDKNLKVVEIKENVQPESFPAAFTSKTKALYVIELNGGVAQKYNIKVGEKAVFLNSN
jgi:hypothetical protein